MPIVFNNDTTHKNDDTKPAHDPVYTRSAVARRTLSSGGLSRLKREAGTLSHHHSHLPLRDHDHHHDPVPSLDQDTRHSHSPLQKPRPSGQATLSESTDLGLARCEQESEKHTDVECSGPTFSLRHLRRDSVHDAEPGIQNQNYLNNARPCQHHSAERDRAATSPSPSLSPCPSTCSSSSATSSPSSPSQTHELLPRHSSLSPSAPTETAIIPLSPPASASATSPPPSALSTSATLDSQACSMDVPTSPPSLALTPLLSAQKRGSESGRPERFSKRRRSMDSLRQLPLPLENEDGPSKGECAAGPLSPLPAVRRAASGMTETTADGTFAAALGLGRVSDSGNRPASGDSPLLAHDGAQKPAPEMVRENDPVHPSSPASEVQDISQKPAISYAALISQAILESTRMKLTLGDIYAWIMTNYPYYRYSSSGWQNSIRHNLSLNKAFLKLDRTQDEPGKGCFWTLHEDAKESCAAATLCRKRKGSSEMNTPASFEHDASLNAAVAARSKGSMLPKLDCRASGLPPSRPQPTVESVPSPAASEDAEDVKSPRRSGRARRPPRHKEAEDYVVHHARQPSLSGLSLSTPPSSPAPFAQDLTMNPTTASTRKRAGSVRMERGSFASASLVNSGDGDSSAVVEIRAPGAAVTARPSSAGNSPAPESAPASRTTATAATGRSIPEAELTAIPGVVTSQRVRRPPQNLAEFVSSEDFKAAPFGCNKRTLQPSMSSSSLNATTVIAESGRAAGKREKKRSKSEGQLWCSNSGKRATAAAAAAESDMDNVDGLAKGRGMKDRQDTAEADWTSPPSSTQQQGQQLPASVSLSALSHSKRASQDLRCFGRAKKAQRRGQCEQSALRRRIFERRRREGRREIMVASEDDWSDSDFDFLRDEEENYRLMRLRVERLQVGDHGFRKDMDHEDDDGGEEDEEDRRKRASGAEDEKIKLLMDPSVINYGFDSCDGEYILDYHQGPLFNNVTWPEFSDVKDDKNDKSDKDEKDQAGSGSSSGSGRSSRDKSNGGSNSGTDEAPTSNGSAADTGVHEVDPSVVAEVISVLVGRAQQQQEAGPIDPLSPLTPMSPLSPLCTPTDTESMMSCLDESVRAKEVGDMEQAWASFVTKCAPAMQDSSSASRRSPGPGSSMDMHAQGKMDKASGVAMELPLLAETELVAVAVVAAVAVESDIHMADTAQVDAGCVRTVVKEEIEAEDFIGWSLCD